MEDKVAIRQEAPIALTPAEVVENSTVQAKLLMDIVEKTKCYQQIASKKYLQVEAWETIGAFNQTHAETDYVTPIKRDTETVGYQAKVNIIRHGEIVGSGVMPCFFTENCCKGKEGDSKHKACMSAAQTFAESKAYRMNYSHVAILAGYQPTPAEEMSETQVEEVNKTEHWCEKHQTKFFKGGKMKSYAHPIQGTEPTEWCHESSEEKKAPESTPASVNTQTTDKETMPIQGTLSYEDVKNYMSILHWKESAMISRMRTTYKLAVESKGDDTLKIAIEKLTAEQALKIKADLNVLVEAEGK